MNTTINKSALFFLFVLISISLFSQVRIWSPYSRYGLGELNFGKTSFLSSMGGTSVGFRNANYINYTNPASYSSIQEKSFLFDAGAIFAPRILENSETKETTIFSSLNNLQFAFPVMKNWGISLGMLPYSNIGYKIKNEEIIDSVGTVNYTYEGWGGLNSVYLGTGAEIVKGLSVGVNMNYYFGNIERRRIAFFDSTGFSNSRLTNRVNISDIGLNFGIQYQLKINKEVVSEGVTKKEFSGYILTLGLNGGNASSLNASENILAVHFNGDNSFAIARDTVYKYENQKNNITLPLHLGGGFFFEKQNRWMVGTDVLWQKWTDFSFLGINDTLKNSLRISLGGSLSPKDKPTMNMLKRSTVLWGVHYYNNYLELKNTPLTQYGISFGIAMPVRRTGTSLQISFEIGQTGTTDNNLIKETYGKLKIGVSITDKWFYRSKYD